jgi:hypothetical protein
MVTYFHSDLLNKKCKLDTDTELVTVQELSDLENKYVTYNKTECEILEYKEIDPYIFKLKKMYGGEIVEHVGLSELRMKGIL